MQISSFCLLSEQPNREINNGVLNQRMERQRDRDDLTLQVKQVPSCWLIIPTPQELASLISKSKNSLSVCFVSDGVFLGTQKNGRMIIKQLG